MSTQLRKADESDLGFAKACAEAAYSLYVARVGKRPAPMDQDFAKAVRDGELDILEYEGKPVGYVVSRSINNTLFAENLAIEPSSQGKGLASWLMAFLEKRSIELGLKSIELYTNAKMHENQGLYIHLGFEIFDRRTENGFDRVYFRQHLSD